jgi:ribonucleoside-triphosphate reductase
MNKSPRIHYTAPPETPLGDDVLYGPCADANLPVEKGAEQPAPSHKITKCGMKTEVYSRVCGYYRPVENWNRGKKEEFKERKNYNVPSKEAIKEKIA